MALKCVTVHDASMSTANPETSGTGIVPLSGRDVLDSFLFLMFSAVKSSIIIFCIELITILNPDAKPP